MAEAGREVFDAFPDWVRIAFYAAAATALAVFAIGAWLRARPYLAARKSGRWNDLVGRVLRAVRKVTLTRSRIWRNDLYAGVAHDMILWGFGILFLGTLIITLEEDVTKPLLNFSFLHGTTYLTFSLLLDLFGVVFLVGLFMMIGRRLAGRSSRLKYTKADAAEGLSLGKLIMDDRVFLSFLLFAGFTGFITEGVRIYVDGTSFAEEWSPIGVLIASGIGASGIGASAAFDIHLALWWIHGIGALAFIAYLPFSKAFHILAGFGSVVFSDELAGKRLPAPASAEPTGFSRASDFTRVQLMHLDACVRCGRCHDVCPAQISGLPLSPRGLILQLKSFVGSLGRAPAHPVVGNAVEQEALWACTTCMACMDACPLQVEHLPLIVEMRRYLVSQGQMDENLQAALTSLSRYGNSFKKPSKMRSKWSETANPSVRDARKEPVEYLWLLGDYASYDPRLQKVTSAVASVFSKVGLDYGILHDAERNLGNDVRRIGEEGLFQMLRDENVARLKDCKFRDLITTDPHTYNTVKNEYPGLNGGRVLHYTELLDELVRSGQLKFSRKLSGRVTYHDPCYLGRYNGVYDAPRNVLRALGLEVVEMPRTMCTSFCCGGGGGRIWMGESPGQAVRPAELRVKEAASLDRVNTLVVTCPKDYVMFTDAVKTAGVEETLHVKDLIELVREAIE